MMHLIRSAMIGAILFLASLPVQAELFTRSPSPGYTASTCTPVLGFGGASVGIAYGALECSYTQIGRLICGQIYIVLTNKGSSTGSARITGLPGAAIGNGSAVAVTPLVGFSSLTAGLGGYIGGSTINITAPTTTGGTQATDANFSNTSQFFLSFCYNT